MIKDVLQYTRNMKDLKKQNFITWCRVRHDHDCNQKYDGNMPYSKHLEFVVAQAKKFKYLLDSDWTDGEFTLWDCIEMACWGHDLIEDARVTYNDIVERVGKFTADLIYACTEEKGKDRNGRHNEKYYTELAASKYGIFVKLCDICANATFSVLTNSSMLEKHRKEHEHTIFYLYRKEYKPMFDYLDGLFDITKKL